MQRSGQLTTEPLNHSGSVVVRTVLGSVVQWLYEPYFSLWFASLFRNLEPILNVLEVACLVAGEVHNVPVLFFGVNSLFNISFSYLKLTEVE